MKIIGGNRFALRGDAGEVITVKVKSEGTAHLVTYLVEGGQVIGGPNEGSMTEGVSLRFTLVKTADNRNNLSLGFTFASPPGQPPDALVEYDIEVTGNGAGSDTSREFVSGAFGIPGDNRQWRFFIN